MNRTGRLYALVEQLKMVSETGTTAATLAETFEVSQRTIKLDILALQEAGLPIWAQPGPGGGYRFLARRTPALPITFTPGEAAAVAVALNTQANLPFATEGAVALAKILTALEHADGNESVGALLNRVWTTTSPRRVRAAQVLDTGIQMRKVVSITYVDATGNETSRLVDPLQFAHTGGHWYLLGYCRLREGGRWFRLDRVKSARLTRRPAVDYDVASVVGLPPNDAHPITDNI